MRHGRVIALALAWIGTSGASSTPPPIIDVGPDLYPPEALAQRLEGEVPITLSVDPTGALRCAAEPGGPLGALKRPSCLLVAARDIFPPKLEKGHAVATEYKILVRWSLKTDNRQFGGAIPIGRPLWVRYADYPYGAYHRMQGGPVNVTFDINEVGRVENCKATHGWTPGLLESAVCPLLVQRALFLPALGPDQRPIRTKGWFNTMWAICSNDPCGSLDAGP